MVRGGVGRGVGGVGRGLGGVGQGVGGVGRETGGVGRGLAGHRVVLAQSTSNGPSPPQSPSASDSSSIRQLKIQFPSNPQNSNIYPQVQAPVSQ